MPAPAPLRIFISYAHRDGAPLALRLQKDPAAASFEVWLDTRALHAAGAWTLEIEQAIDHSQIVLALLTPASYLSEICRAGQLRSLRQGTPKGTSKRYKSEIHRDTGWQAIGQAGFEPVRAVAIDEDWSALRFRRNRCVR